MVLTQSFWKKWPENAGKIKGKISFSPLWFLIQKLDHNSGLHAKNQRDISSNKVRRLLWSLGGVNCGKGGRKFYKERGKCIIRSRIELPDLMFMILDTPHEPNTKLLKKCLKNAGKIKAKIIFSPFWFLTKKLDHNSGLHAKIREISLKTKSETPPPTLCMEMWTFPFYWNTCLGTQRCIMYL